MPNPAGNPAPARRSTKDIALKALVRAVALPALVLVINTVRDGWSTSSSLLVLGVGIPLLWVAFFVADRYVQPAVDRRNAQRRNARSQGAGTQGVRGQQSQRQASQKQGSGRNSQRQGSNGKSQNQKSQNQKSQGQKSPGGKSQNRKTQNGKAQRRK